MAASIPKGIVPKFKFNDDQKTAYGMATSSAHKYLLFYGPSRSGKSFLILYIILLRALRAPGSRHAVFRGARNACETTLFKLTLNQVLDKCFAGLREQCEIRLSDMTVTLPNGSMITFDGLDADRMDKVLGNEFNTVWINECNDDEIDYGTVSQLMSRLSVVSPTEDGKILVNKMFFDCNPRFYSDWEYKAFKQHVNPEDGDAMPDPSEWVHAKLRTEANLENIADGYVKTLQAGSAAKRQRFLVGEWCDENQSAMFGEKMFRDYRVPRPNDIDSPQAVQSMLADQGIQLRRITIAVDPAKSADAKSDLTGITVQGLADDGHVFVLADLSDRYTPNQACEEIKQAYYDWGVSRIVVESNAAGSWLDATMRHIFPAAPIKNIAATSQTGGKKERAEPVSAQYERGVVHHVGTFRELESQMCEYGSPAQRRRGKSPDRMDAVVWGITELLDLANEETRTPGYTALKTVRLR